MYRYDIANKYNGIKVYDIGLSLKRPNPTWCILFNSIT